MAGVLLTVNGGAWGGGVLAEFPCRYTEEGAHTGFRIGFASSAFEKCGRRRLRVACAGANGSLDRYR